MVPLGAEPGSPEESDSRYPIEVGVLSFSSPADAASAAGIARSLDPARYVNGPVLLASPYQTLRQYRQTRRTFDRLIWLVALLTGASAVFGISNLLSASVIARTREIGVRRAVGARTRDIVLQFQLEGILLGILGGGAGLLLGLAISLLSADRSGGTSSLSLLSFSALAVACVAIGILTGIRPSARAARIDRPPRSATAEAAMPRRLTPAALLLLIAVAPPSPLTAQDAPPPEVAPAGGALLTIGTALRMALTRNPDLLNSSDALLSAQWNERAVRSTFLPQVVPFFATEKSDETGERTDSYGLFVSEQFPFGTALTGQAIVNRQPFAPEGESHTSDYRLTLSQPLLRGVDPAVSAEPLRLAKRFTSGNRGLSRSRGGGRSF